MLERQKKANQASGSVSSIPLMSSKTCLGIAKNRCRAMVKNTESLHMLNALAKISIAKHQANYRRWCRVDVPRPKNARPKRSKSKEVVGGSATNQLSQTARFNNSVLISRSLGY